MSKQTEFKFKEDQPLHMRMADTQRSTKFLEIIETYIDVIAETGTKTTFEKSCAIECLRNLGEILDGRYSPDIYPCLAVVQWGKVNRGEVTDYKYNYTDEGEIIDDTD